MCQCSGRPQTFTKQTRMKRNGSRGHCPFCRTALPAPTSAYGGTHCPRCNGQLWNLALASGPAFFLRRAGESIYDLMADLADSRHGFAAECLESCLRDADALDVVEFLVTFENALRSRSSTLA